LLRPQIDKIILPHESPLNKAVYHLYVIRVKNRDQLQAHLAQANIATQIHYPTPLHLQRAYATMGYKEGDFPVTEKAATEILSLPMYPQLEHQQQKVIVQELVDLLLGVTAGIGNSNLEPVAAPEGHAD
jgi:dTDP-4-amino-4,6-dideoxygalactose transaminase